MNIEISNLKTHFFNKDKESIEKKQNSKKYKRKIIEYSFYSINDANISNKIKKIPYYSNYFSVLEKYDFIDINNIREKSFEKVEMLDKSKQYLLFTYNNHQISDTIEDYMTFDIFLFQFKDPKLLIYNVITTFSYLLQSLIKLQDEKLCFFQLSHENIIFDLNFREKPLLQNFQLSLQLSKLNEEYIANIIKKTKDYSLKPVEVHVLFYLINNDIVTISYSIIEEIVEVFIKNLSILSFFSQDYKESYKNQCINCLKKYINKSKKDIVSNILNQNQKWDVYSISVLYIHIFANISKVFSLKNTFINKLLIELSRCCHPEPLKRTSLVELLIIFDKLLDLQKDWSFVNSIDNKKMCKLWNILKK
jgi:hypothetical protein